MRTWHVARAGVSVGGGYTHMHHWSRLDGTIEHLDTRGDVTKTDQFALGGTYTWRGFVLGAGIRYGLSRHIAVVAEVNHYLFIPSDTGTWIFRPALGFRWTF